MESGADFDSKAIFGDCNSREDRGFCRHNKLILDAVICNVVHPIRLYWSDYC